MRRWRWATCSSPARRSRPTGRAGRWAPAIASPPTPELLRRLVDAAGPDAAHGPIVTSDLFYDGPAGAEEGWRTQGAMAVEMETATLFALAARRGLRAGCALIVSDTVLPTRRRIDTEALHDAERRLGDLALAALS